MSYDVVVDPDQAIIRGLGGTGLPTTLLVKGDGTVVRVSGPGAVNPAKLQGWIDHGQPVRLRHAPRLPLVLPRTRRGR